MPQVSIITVGMNHLEFLKNFFASLYGKEAGLDFEVIYVDNCSTDGSVDFITSNYPDVKVIKNTDKKGFAANNNIGARIAKGKYLAIINPDIVLKENSLKTLFDFAESHSEWGVLAPKLLNADGSLQYSVRTFISLKVMFCRIFTLGKDRVDSEPVNSYLCKDIDDSKIQNVDWAIGAALFVRKDFFDQIGGFDESYFLYMEDEDFCLRSWQANMPVVYVPTSEMCHVHLRTSSKLGRMTLIHFKSLVTFFKKHGFSVKRPDLGSN